MSAPRGSARGGLLLGGSAPGRVPAPGCCDMDQSDTIGKIELIPLSVLSSDNTNYKNDIQ